MKSTKGCLTKGCLARRGAWHLPWCPSGGCLKPVRWQPSECPARGWPRAFLEPESQGAPAVVFGFPPLTHRQRVPGTGPVLHPPVGFRHLSSGNPASSRRVADSGFHGLVRYDSADNCQQVPSVFWAGNLVGNERATSSELQATASVRQQLLRLVNASYRQA